MLLRLARPLAPMLVSLIELTIPAPGVRLEVSRRPIVEYDVANIQLLQLELLPFQVLHGFHSILHRAAPSSGGTCIESTEDPRLTLALMQQHSALIHQPLLTSLDSPDAGSRHCAWRGSGRELEKLWPARLSNDHETYAAT